MCYPDQEMVNACEENEQHCLITDYMPDNSDNGDKHDTPPNHETANCQTVIDQTPELSCPLILDKGDPGFDDRNSEAEGEARNREFDMFDNVDTVKSLHSQKPSTSLHKDFITQTHRDTKINTNTIDKSPMKPITNVNLAHQSQNNSPIPSIDKHTADSNPAIDTDDIADLDFDPVRVEELPESNDKAQLRCTTNSQEDHQPAAVASHRQSQTTHTFDATPTNQTHHSPASKALPNTISGQLQQNDTGIISQHIPTPQESIEKLTDEDINVEHDFLDPKQGITTDNIRELDEKLCNNLYKDILEQGQKLASLQSADVNFTHIYLYKLNNQLPVV